jgi:hypothetical protein
MRRCRSFAAALSRAAMKMGIRAAATSRTFGSSSDAIDSAAAAFDALHATLDGGRA